MHITLMNNVYTPINPDYQIEESWDCIAALLQDFIPAKTKEDVMMFNLWQFKTISEGAELGRRYHDETKETWDDIPNTIRRCGNNAVGLWGLVLDYDGQKTLEEAVVEMDGIECVIYTTFNHSAEKDKFRVVLPFTRMMPLEEFNEKEADMQDCFPAADRASFSLSQAIYLHSGAHPELKFAYNLKGAMVDPDMFKRGVSTPHDIQLQQQTIDANVSPAYKQAVIMSLSSCRGVRRGCSKSDQGVLGLAQIAKSVNCSFEEFQQICNQALALDSQVRDSNAQKRVWNDATLNRVSRETRDRFIAQHNGKSISECYQSSLSPFEVMYKTNQKLKQQIIRGAF